MNQKSIKAAVLVIGLLLLFTGCGEKKTSTTTSEETSKPVAVTTGNVTRTTVESIVTLNGKVSPKKEVDVMSKIAGKVEKVNYDLGDRVQKGDILFVLEQKDINLQVSQAKAAVDVALSSYNRAKGGTLEQQMVQLRNALETASTNYSDAKTDYERTKQLFSADGVSKQMLEASQTKLKLAEQQYISAKQTYSLTERKINPESIAAAKAQLDQAEAAYDIAKSQLDNTVVRAPISGIIASKNVKSGEFVSTAAAAMSIADLSSAVVEVGVTEDIINKIKTGDKVKVGIESASNGLFEGQITNIAPVSDSKTQTYPVKIQIDNDAGQLKGGMFAEVKFAVDKAENTLAVPLAAVVDDGGKKIVYVVNGDKVSKKEITVGYSDGSLVQVTKGVNENDKVVLEGQTYIQDNSKVMITNSK